jgi:AraC-like DNA-binding protein
MKPYLEHIVSPTDSSWVLFDRRLDHIPFEWHYNTEYELTLTLNSRGQRFIGDNIGFYEDGDLVLIGPKIPHTWYSSGDVDPSHSHQAIVLWFTEKFVKGMIEPHVELRPIDKLLKASTRALSFSENTRLRARGIICRMIPQTPAARLLSLLEVLLLLADDQEATRLTSDVSETNSFAAATEERIGRVVSYLHTHYREEIALPKLMRIAALSRSSLHRSFKHQTNMTIGDYIAQLRIGNACALLINSGKPISLIADEVGYTNLANFNRQFKSLKGKTPREFRAAFNG